MNRTSPLTSVGVVTVTFLLLAMGLVMSSTPASAATAVITNVSMRAPVHTSYDHSTGGGAWNTGSTTYVKGELLGTDFRCGDVTTYLLQLSVANSPTMQPSPYTAQIVMDFTTDSTGQSGVALQPLTTAEHLRVNDGVIAAPGTGTGTSGSDGGFVPSGSGMTTGAQVVSSGGVPVSNVTQVGGAIFTSGSKARLTFSVEGLASGTTTILRSDARILCKPYSSPTGNLQVSVNSINITAPGSEVVSSGNQTVNFRGVGNLGGLGVPELELIKDVIEFTGSETCPTTPTGNNVVTTTNSSIDVLYCYYLTNYGTADAANVALVDDNADPGSTPTPITLTGLSAGSLLAGATATGTLGPITFSSGGDHTNIATATSSTGSVTAIANATVEVHSGVVVTKTVTTASGTCPGEPVLFLDPSTTAVDVKYCYEVTNYGNVTVTGVNLSDDMAGLSAPQTVTLSGLSGGDLPASATATGEIIQTIQPVDQTGNVTNTVTPTWDGQTQPTETATVIFNTPVPHLSLDKVQTSVATPSAVGDVITYTITGTNDGDLDLTAVDMTDANATVSNCSPALPIASLVVGATFTCDAAHTVTQADLDAGSVVNSAVGTATPPSGPPISPPSNEVTTPVTQSPAIGVVKTIINDDALYLGEELVYEIVATNTGNVTLADVTITDANAAVGDCTPAIPVASLAPGATVTCAATHALTVADLLAAQVDNNAVASGTPPSGEPISGNDDAPTVNIAPSPKIDIVIEPPTNPPTTEGDTVTYTVRITNRGNRRLLGVTPTVNNAVLGECTPPIGSQLDPGEEMVCSATHVITAEDVRNRTIFVTAEVASTTVEGDPVGAVANEVITPVVLPVTGSDARTPTLIGLGALLVGFVLTLLSRRRRTI